MWRFLRGVLWISGVAVGLLIIVPHEIYGIRQVQSAQRNAGTSSLHSGSSNCTLLKRKRKTLKPPSPRYGEAEDITQEMLEAHKVFTDAHGVPPFTANITAQNAALRWCEVQVRANCDLVYPLNEALNAAVAPAFLTPKEIVQFWYNERSNYDVQQPLLSNIMKAQQNGYEVLHYANIVADYTNRQLGCCRALCRDKVCMVYGCVYFPHGTGYWTVGENPTNQGFLFHVPEGVKDESFLLSTPKVNLVTRVSHEEQISAGCTARVPGNGPTSVVEPWVYPCRKDLDSTATPVQSHQKSIIDEQKFFFTSIPVATADCNILDVPLSPPYLLYCPRSCMDQAVKSYRKMQNIDKPTAETYTVHDVGQSMCGRTMTQHTGLPDGLYTLFHIDIQKQAASKNVLARSSCSAIQDSFLDCGTDRLGCHARIRVAVDDHPWLAADLDTAAHNAIGQTVLLLRHSLCASAALSLNLLPLHKPVEHIGLLASFLNPSNFVAFDVDTTTAVATLLSCHNGNCTRQPQAFLGDILHRPLQLELRLHAEPEGMIRAVVDGETIGSIRTRGEGLGTLGAFGLTISKDTDLQYIDRVALTPLLSGPPTNSETQHLTSSYLPFWTLGGGENTTAELYLAKRT